MAAERDLLKGKLLDAWLEDLRNDREPRKPPVSFSLSAEDLEEVMRLARWYKAMLFPSAPPHPRSIDELPSRLAERALQARADEADEVQSIVSRAATFAEAIRESATRLGIDLRNVEAACALPKGTFGHLLAEEIPPHRMSLEKMLVFFCALRLPVAAVALLRRASIAWAHGSFDRTQTRLGRIDWAIDNSRRSELLGADDAAAAFTKELERIDAYCDALRSRVDSL